MIIYVKTFTGKNFEIEVLPSDTIGFVKEKIQEKEDVSPDNMGLVFNGIKLEDERNVSDYHIYNKSTIFMVIKIRGHTYVPIYIRCQRRAIQIEICLCYHIEQVKDKIHQKIGLNPECQLLYFKGNILDKKGLDMGSYGVKKASILDMVILPEIKGFSQNYDDNEDYKKNDKNKLIQLKKY